MANTKKYVSLDKLGLYDEKIKKYLADADSVALQAAKDYADGLADNYDAAGAAAGALADAKAYADGKDAAIAEAKKAGTDAAAAAAVADGKAVAAQGEIDALETYVGTFTASEGVDTVVKYIDAKTANIASDETVSALAGRVTQAEKDIDAIEADYLKAADKTELEGKITTVETAVATEKSRAEGIEAGLETRLAAVEGDYLKAADRTALEQSIATNASAIERLTNGVSAEEIDGVNDLIQYVKDHGAEVTGMQDDIAQNAADIAGVAERMGVAEGAIEDIEDAVATKVEQSAYDTKIAALESADAGQVERIVALEAKFTGDESVADQIAAAKAEAIEAAGTAADTKDEAVLAAAKKYADDEDAKIESRVDALETASATHALASDLTALDGRVTTAEGKVSTLEGKMTAAEAQIAANKAAHEANAAAVATKAEQAALTAVSDRVTTIETWHANFTEVSEEEINALFA